jgi:crotonobetainyl-CoA:carnitine CoA-transferase CaiB-like acyl-CoA transferase
MERQMAETPPVRLVVLGPGTQFYGTRALVAGDQFEMSREWADILIRLGKARLADDTPASTQEAKQTEKAEAKAEMKAETATAEIAQAKRK